MTFLEALIPTGRPGNGLWVCRRDNPHRWQPLALPASEVIRKSRASLRVVFTKVGQPVSVLETDLIDYIYLDGQDETPVLVVSDPLT